MDKAERTAWKEVLKDHLGTITAKGRAFLNKNALHAQFTLVAVHEKQNEDPHPHPFVSRYSPDRLAVTKAEPEAIFNEVSVGLLGGTKGKEDLSPLFVFLFGEDQDLEPLKFKIENGNLKHWNGKDFV